MPKRPRGEGLSRRIVELLTNAPRPLFMGEINAMLEFAYECGELSSALAKMERSGKVESKMMDREGPGRHQAKAFSLPGLALWERPEIRHICQRPK